MSPTQTGPLADVHAYLKGKDKDFTADLPTFEQDMQDDEVRQQVYDYLKGQDKEFTASFDEFSTDLGVKKKSGTSDGGQQSSTSAPTTPTLGEPTLALDPLQMEDALGVRPQDIPQQVFDEDFGNPKVGELGYQLPGAPLPAAEQALVPELQSQVPYAPGSQVAPLAQNLPYADELPPDARAPAQEEAAYLQQLPPAEDQGLRADGTGYDATPYGKELVAIPNDYTGAVPAGTFQLKLAGPNDATQYFYRDLNKTVDGKEQSYGDAIAGKVKNALYNMGEGIAEGGQALLNTGALPYQMAVGDEMAPRMTVGDEASEAIEKAKTPIAPYYNQSFSRHKNWETTGLMAADYAPMVIAQVAQTLAPELRAPAALQKALGFVTATGFDADMYHAAHEHAKQIFPNDPRKVDLYTLFEGTLTVAGFKTGSKLMTELGDKLAYKASPFSLKRTVAADATERLAVLETRIGRQATDAEYKQVLHDSLRAALPKLAQIPKEAFQQAGTFAGVEAAKIIGNQLAAPALGGEADDLGADPGLGALKRIGEAAGAGAGMGLVTGLTGSVLPTTQLMESRPTEAPAPTVDVVRPTGQVEMRGAEIVGQYDPNSATVTVRAPDAQGNWQQMDVPQEWLKPSEQAPEVVQPSATENVAPEPVGDDSVSTTTQTTAEPAPDQTTTPSTPGPEPSPVTAIDEPASPPDAVGGELPTTNKAEPVASSEPLPEATPDPAQVKVLTRQQQATNDTLDALDRYNALRPGQQKGKEGSAARAEIAREAKKAGIEVTVDKAGKVTLAGGKRLTRSNEYTATTPAANHVPLDARPEDAHAFMEAMLFTGDEANVKELQGLGIKIRGKELNARELGDAVKDIRAGRNTLRAQLVLDTLENAHRQGFVEKSTGTGLATQKFRVPIDEYMGNADESPTGEPRDLTDDELDAIYESDPKAKQAVDDYAFSDGTIDYEKLARDERGLSFMFDVSDETATKLATLARERISQPPTSSAESRATASGQPEAGAEASPDTGSTPESAARVDEPAPASEPEVEIPAARAPAAGIEQSPGPSDAKKAEIRAEIDAASQRIKERRAARKKEGKVFSAPIGEIDVEDLKDALTIAKGHVQLGVLGIKNLIAEIRKAGLDEQAASDEALRPQLTRLLLGEDETSEARPQQPTDPTNTKERQGAQSVANSGLSDELSQGLIDRKTNLYTPKPLAETKAHVDRIIASEGIDKAYYTATHAANTIPKDVHEVLRIQVMAHYDNEVRRLREDPTANAAAIDEAVERAGNIADVYVAGGTEDGRAMRARQVLQEYAPSVAVARLGREVRETADAKRKALEPAGRARAKAVRQQKAKALDAALASPAVQAKLGVSTEPAPARAGKTVVDPPGWGSKNKYFTKESAQAARAALRKLGLSTVVPPELIHFLGFHIEAGARSFADVSARAVRDLGQKVRPLLPEAYEQAKKEFILRGGDNTGFDGPDGVEAALRGELAENLAERIVASVKPARPGVFDPVRDMLDTLTKKVRENLPASDKTPRAARELLALAINNRREYTKVFEESKSTVLDKIAASKLPEATKQRMVDALTDFMDEATGDPYAQQHFARAVQQAEDASLANLPGKNRGDKLDYLAKMPETAYRKIVEAIQAHVTAEVRATDTEAIELREAVREAVDQKVLARRRALRAQQGIYEEGQEPAPKASPVRPTLSKRVRDLLALRATDQQVADKLAPAAVREGLQSEGRRIQQIARDHLNDPTDIGHSLAEAFVRDAGIPTKRAQLYADAIEQEFARQVAKVRDKAVQDAYSRKVRTSEPKAAQGLTDRVRKLYTLSPTDEGRVLGLVADEAGLPELTKADNTKLYKLAQAVADAKGDNAKARAVQQFYLGVKTIRGLTGWEQVKTVMYANMLSGLGTQLKNVNSTGLNTASDLFYATGWAGFLAVRQAARTGDLSALKLAVAPIKGIFNRSGADRAYQMLTTGVRPPGYEGKFDEASDLETMAMLTPKNRKQAAMKAYANFAKYIPRLLGANDLMWSGGAEQMWAYNIALTDAVREGRNLPTDQIWASVNERLFGTTVRLADAQAQAAQELGTSGGGQYRMRVQELMEASRDQRIAAESKRAAAETTFNGPMEGFIGDVMSKLGRLTEAETGRGTQPLKGVIPFTRIVGNVTNAFLNYTPVGFIRAAKGRIGSVGNNPLKPNSFSREYSPMERSVVFSKALTGAIVMAAAYQLLDDDNLTGNGPSDPAQNRAWQQRGHKAYTIGGVNYKDSPWYYPLAAVAALKEAQSYDGADFENDPVFAKRAARMLVATTQASFASLSLTNLQDFLNALSDPSKGKDPAERMGRYMQRTVGAVASSVLLPGSGLLRGASRMGQQMAGSTKREATDVWGMMGQDVPFGVRDMLPRVYDVLGNEVPVGANVPFMPVPEIQDESGATKRINEFLDSNKLFIPDINRYQSDMQVLKGRVGELSAAEKAKMSRMTDTERKKYLLSRLGGEGPMPADKWQEFYPKRGRLIKEKLLLHLPELEKLAKENPRKLRKKLNRYYRQATKQAKKGIDFSDPDVLPVQEE